MAPENAALLLIVSGLWGLGGAAISLFVLLGKAEASRARRVRLFVGVPLDKRDEKGLKRLLGEASVVRAQPAAAPVALIGGVLVAGIWGAVAGAQQAPVLALIAAGVILFLRRPRNPRARLERQAPAATALLASGLRAGYSVHQSLELVARESPEPTASRFAVTSREVGLGVSFHEALTKMAEQTGVPDYHLVSILISIQHDVGGNLAQALDGVGEVLRERAAVREQVGTLTAQQRLSGLVLSGLPVGILGLLWLVVPSFPEQLLGTTVGLIILGAVTTLLVLNWFGMRAVGRVDL